MLNILSAALIGLSAQSAQPAPAPQDDAIVITGERLEERIRAVRQSVEVMADAPRTGQITKFHDPLCPVAFGLSEETDAAITARMRAVAAAAKIAVADEPCSANILFVITDNRPALFQAWRQKYGRIFNDMNGREIRALRDDPAPLVAWQLVQQANEDLEPLPKDLISGYTILEDSGDVGRIRRNQRPDTRAAIVVMNRYDTYQMGIQQLADHALIRALAPVDMDALDELRHDSILHLFEDRAAGQTGLPTLSRHDLAFIEALYETENIYSATRQRLRIRNKMMEILAREDR